MITRHGQKVVRLDSLKLPGDIRERQKKPHVIALAESFASTGGLPMHAPTVDKETHRIVAGRDRAAAMLLAGIKEAPVEQVSGDPIDLARATIIENFHRRPDDRQALAKQLTDLEQAEFEGKDPEPEPLLEEPKQRNVQLKVTPTINCAEQKEKPKELGVTVTPNCAEQKEKPKELGVTVTPNSVGRPATTGRKQAIERAAKQLNTTPETVKQLVKRAEAKEKKALEQVAPKAAKAPSVITIGIDVPDALAERIQKEQALVDELSSMLTAIAAKLTKLEELTLENGQQRGDSREHLRALSFSIRSTRPYTICPYCKLLPRFQPKCLACKGSGHLPKNKIDSAPKELFLEGDEAGIYVDGKWCSLISLEGC